MEQENGKGMPTGKNEGQIPYAVQMRQKARASAIKHIADDRSDQDEPELREDAEEIRPISVDSEDHAPEVRKRDYR